MKDYSNFKEYGFRELLREFWKRANESHLLDRAAKLAYFFLLSLFPLLLFFMMKMGGLLNHSEDTQ
jgi:uncharacterized BrkB/YihY/UPF0761 family membrane protein